MKTLSAKEAAIKLGWSLRSVQAKLKDGYFGPLEKHAAPVGYRIPVDLVDAEIGHGIDTTGKIFLRFINKDLLTNEERETIKELPSPPCKPKTHLFNFEDLMGKDRY